MINPAVNIIEARANFRNQGIVMIPNFLLPDVAQDLKNTIDVQASSIWFHVISDEGGTSTSTFFIEESTKVNRDSNYRIAFEKFISGKTSHSFKELDIKKGTAELSSRMFFFNSSDFKDTLKFITCYDTSFPEVLVCNKYEAGDFVSPAAVDTRQGIVMLYNLTQNWNFNYGGQNYFVDGDSNSIVQVHDNVFNSLLLYDPTRFKDLKVATSMINCTINELYKLCIHGLFIDKSNFLKKYNIQ